MASQDPHPQGDKPRAAFGGEIRGILEAETHPVMYYRRRDDDSGTFLFVGGWAQEVTGQPRARLEGGKGSLAEIIHPDDRERVIETVRGGVEANRLLRVDYRLIRADGQERHVVDRCRAFWNEEGKVEFFEGIIMDPLMCEKEAEQALFSEDRYRAMLDASFEGLAVHDKGVFLDGNPAFSKMLGYLPEEMIGKSVLDVIAKEDHEMVMQKVKEGYGKPYRLTGVRKDGSRFPAQVRGKDLVYQGKPLRVVAVQDITVFMKAEETLKTANERLEEKVEERTRQLQERQAELNRMNQALLRELAMARQVQESLLPDRTLKKPGVSVAVTYLPALEVGGDAYQFIQLGDGRIAALIADLTGHGIQAALSTVLVTSTFTSHAGKNTTAQGILKEMNAALRSGLPSGTYAAALVMIYEPGTGKCEILNAGIPDPLLKRKDSSFVDVVSCRGPLLGVLEDEEYARFEHQTIELAPEDVLLLFTDGLAEVRDRSGKFFGSTRLRDLLLESNGEPPEKLPDRLLSEARDFSGPLHAWDDVTVLSLVRTS